MFVDRTRIRVTGGGGGNGCCSFRREKFVPRGGPNGGDGGQGGDVWLVADATVTSLEPLRFHAHYQGERGVHGGGSNCHGRHGSDLIIPVPLGTLVRDFATEEILADLTQEGQRFRAAKGGQGGKGNARFSTSTNRAPHFAERGEPGEEAEYMLELKLIAEVGVVGLPNAGKSTLLSRMTAAHPKIAGYPFTTLSPNLGVAVLSDFRTLTVADIPGIIEGAAEGKGLGHDFLRHIERTKVLLFLVDMGDDDPAATLAVLESELAQYSEAFADRPKVLALNKADIPENRARFEVLTEALGPAFCLSAATGEGIAPLVEALWQLVQQVRQEETYAPEVPEPAREYLFEPPFTIEREGEGFRVAGKTALRTVIMTDFENDYAVQNLDEKLRRMGLFRALRRMGARPGDSIMFGDIELEYHPDE